VVTVGASAWASTVIVNVLGSETAVLLFSSSRAVVVAVMTQDPCRLSGGVKVRPETSASVKVQVRKPPTLAPGVPLPPKLDPSGTPASVSVKTSEPSVSTLTMPRPVNVSDVSSSIVVELGTVTSGLSATSVTVTTTLVQAENAVAVTTSAPVADSIVCALTSSVMFSPRLEAGVTVMPDVSVA
jgi:hypothetical protein